MTGNEPSSASQSTNFQKNASVNAQASSSPSLSGASGDVASSSLHTSRHTLPEPKGERATTRRPEVPVRLDDVHTDDEHESVDDLATILDDSPELEIRRKQLREAALSSRSEAMARVSQEADEEEARIQRERRELALKRNKRQTNKHSVYFDAKETLKLVGWLSAFVGTLAVLAWEEPEFRLPLGGVLCVTGALVYLLGSASLRSLVAEEGQIQEIVFLIFPPYQWWFVWSRWSRSKGFASFFGAGLLIMAIGVTIITESHAGKRWAKSGRDLGKSPPVPIDAYKSSPHMPDPVPAIPKEANPR